MGRVQEHQASRVGQVNTKPFFQTHGPYGLVHLKELQKTPSGHNESQEAHRTQRAPSTSRVRSSDVGRHAQLHRCRGNRHDISGERQAQGGRPSRLAGALDHRRGQWAMRPSTRWRSGYLFGEVLAQSKPKCQRERSLACRPEQQRQAAKGNGVRARPTAGCLLCFGHRPLRSDWQCRP